MESLEDVRWRFCLLEHDPDLFTLYRARVIHRLTSDDIPRFEPVVLLLWCLERIRCEGKQSALYALYNFQMPIPVCRTPSEMCMVVEDAFYLHGNIRSFLWSGLAEVPKGDRTFSEQQDALHKIVLFQLRQDFKGLDIYKKIDQVYGVDVSQVVLLDDLKICSPNQCFGSIYEPSSLEMIEKTVQALPIAYERFTFLDLGSGKGLVLLLALQQSFQRIIGVEFSPELHGIAQQNIQRYQGASECSKTRIELYLMDVVDYPLPLENLVVYLFNPFQPPVLERVLQRLKRSFHDHPREMIILYIEPTYDDLLMQEMWLKCLDRTRRYALYVACT
ncbi:class I SAM-dependent methyltransferase [Magnetococcales bacterium HHB-1]